MNLHQEVELENDICAHLAAHGWLHAKDAKRFDTVLVVVSDRTVLASARSSRGSTSSSRAS